jgi:hypothetical protein
MVYNSEIYQKKHKGEHIMKTRLLAFALALTLLASMLLACGGAKDTESTTTAATTTAAVGEATTTTVGEATTEATTTADPNADELPADLTFTGGTVRAVTRTEAAAANEMKAETITGDIINDAVYQKNTLVSERLGITLSVNHLEGQGSSAAIQLIENAMLSGADEYEIVVSSSWKMCPATAKGLFLNLNGLQYLDLEKPYWSQEFNDAVSMGDAQYLCTGPWSLGYYRNLYVQIFNKQMFDEYKVEYPYATVKEGKWTVEKQQGIVSTFYNDLNSNGAVDVADQLGFAICANTGSSQPDSFWGSANLTTVKKTADNYFEFSIDTEKFVNAVDVLLGLMNADGVCGKFGKDAEIFQAFAEDRIAMTNLRLVSLEVAPIRGMSSEYGVLPVPKIEEAQEKYYAHAQDQLLVYGVPATVSEKNFDMVGAFLEAYASEGYKTVKPAYYELVLTAKSVSDQESVDVLDIVTRSAFVDASTLYVDSFPLTVTTLREVMAGGTNTIASKIKGFQNPMKKAVDKINDSFKQVAADHAA